MVLRRSEDHGGTVPVRGEVGGGRAEHEFFKPAQAPAADDGDSRVPRLLDEDRRRVAVCLYGLHGGQFGMLTANLAHQLS
jgi:hypothetical protein